MSLVDDSEEDRPDPTQPPPKETTKNDASAEAGSNLQTRLIMIGAGALLILVIVLHLSGIVGG